MKNKTCHATFCYDISIIICGVITFVFILLQITLWSQVGLRWEGLLPALVVPLFLTFILFLGPLVQSHLSVPITATLRMYLGMFNNYI